MCVLQDGRGVTARKVFTTIKNYVELFNDVIGNEQITSFTQTQTSMSVQFQLPVNRIAQTLMGLTAAPATQDIHWHLTYVAV